MTQFMRPGELMQTYYAPRRCFRYEFFARIPMEEIHAVNAVFLEPYGIAALFFDSLSDPTRFYEAVAAVNEYTRAQMRRSGRFGLG